MEYTHKFKQLKGIFNIHEDLINVTGSNIQIRNLTFESLSSLSFPFEDIYDSYSIDQLNLAMDEGIKENEQFRYPIFYPKSDGRFKSAIILLHGLNEKSWFKYLPWAYFLAEQLNRPVILFPISFHMNRCPDSWSNPRDMMSLVQQRIVGSGNDMLTFANVAISQRLSEDPIRFFRAGKQSADDIIDLLYFIKHGNHPLFEKNTKVDFFSYSIGAFLSQILFIANPDNAFSDSKLFLFCGGACFSEMNGASRLIMDNQAYKSLRKFYLGDFINDLKKKSTFSEYIKESSLGNAFLSMLSPDSNKWYREFMFEKMEERVKAVTLKKDSVIPSNYIKSTLSCIKSKVKNFIEELDFSFEYSHEVPFPILSDENYLQVDKAFERVFTSAVEFYR